MVLLFMFCFLFLEVIVMGQVAAFSGWGLVLLAIGLGSLAGGLLVRSELRRVRERLVAAVGGGEDPARTLEGFMARMGGGLLLALPGFITDLLGLSLLLPLTRPLWRRLLKRQFSLPRTAGGFSFFNLSSLDLSGLGAGAGPRAPEAAAPSSQPAGKIIEADFEILD